jgi:predicted small secreted protein
MKKHTLLIFSFLLLLACALSACGSASNSGQTKDAGTPGATTQVVLHSGGGCWTRYGQLASHADLGQNSDPPRWQVGNSPFFGAQIIACQDVVYLNWSTGYDFYQVRWSRPGLDEQQFSTSSQGSINFTNAHFRTIYSFKLQGCNNGIFGSSCTTWSPTVTVATYYPGDCHIGYVWREAAANDYVCVTPATRSQAASDNSQRSFRINPYGPYGPDTCIQGYVWREAFAGDHVCVTPNVRAQAAYDNSQASTRAYH